MGAKRFAARLAQANVVTKTDFDTKLISINKKSNLKQNVLVEREFKKLQTFDSSYFHGKNYFENDGTENYLVFSQCTILRRLVIPIIFNHMNLRDCLMKLLNLLG